METLAAAVERLQAEGATLTDAELAALEVLNLYIGESKKA